MIEPPMTISETKEMALKELYALIYDIEAERICVSSINISSNIPIHEYSFRVFDTNKKRVSPNTGVEIMTKERLLDKYSKLAKVSAIGTDAYRDLLKLFESNVVIPKGENRHKNADVIHAYAEGLAGIEVLRSEGWAEFKQSGMCLCIGDAYRIKPSDPVHEWQWITFRNGYAEILNELGRNGLHQFFTDDEVDLKVWKKIEETKRVRQ